MRKTRYWVSRRQASETQTSGAGATRYAVQVLRPGHEFKVGFDLAGGTTNRDFSNIVERTGTPVGDWRATSCTRGDDWFSGWYDSIGNMVNYLYVSTEATRNVSARFVPPANVVFDAGTNGGRIFRETGLKYYKGKTYGALPTAVGPDVAKRCTGWFKSPDGDGEPVCHYDECEGDTTLYARYESYTDYFRAAINKGGNVEFDMDLSSGNWEASKEYGYAVRTPGVQPGFETEQHGGISGYDDMGRPIPASFMASAFTMTVSGHGTLSFTIWGNLVGGVVAVVVGNRFEPSSDGVETPNTCLFGMIARGSEAGIYDAMHGVVSKDHLEERLMSIYPDGGYEHPAGDVVYVRAGNLLCPFTIGIEGDGEHVVTVMVGGSVDSWNTLQGTIQDVVWTPDNS